MQASCYPTEFTTNELTRLGVAEIALTAIYSLCLPRLWVAQFKKAYFVIEVRVLPP